ncbi:acyl-CoA dehydrogenase family protein [Bradyrhizobium sp.]|uniref:acyl-CoA dehydrogenase family protein n=1 Tax=Bradyrhizobium sp. TaxID=376 RepID=UPI0023A1D22C|nr:acyl-CoA dehydrogenase family protein [Bradyrhizobium sp.]MDE2378455.1 acyl-CoA dehydrogenase family protein [Bradyrhizobium sp.]
MKIFEALEQGRRWTEDERMLLAQVDRLAKEVIAPNAAEVDEKSAFPWANIKAINELGLNAIFVPEAFGGAPMSFKVYLAIVRRIAEACASTGIIYATNFHAMKPLIEFGSQEQKSRLLPCIAEGGLAALAITEETAGSDATGMRTRFRPDGDDVVVDGAKLFITNGDVADRILLFGKYSEIDDPRKAISVLVLEKGTAGFEVAGLERKMGHRGSSTASLRFDGCRVPRANLIGRPGDGLDILLASLNRSRPSIAAHALGIANAAFKDMVAYINERKQSGRKIIDFQANQFLLADLASDLAMAELWLDRLAERIDAGEKDFGLEASIAKMRASDVANRVATEAVQMHGGYGYCSDFRVERLMRDAKITQIWEGTNQVHRQLIGRSFATK